MITDHKEACEAILGQKLLGIEIRDFSVVLSFEHDNTIEIDGDDFDMTIFVEKVN